MGNAAGELSENHVEADRSAETRGSVVGTIKDPGGDGPHGDGAFAFYLAP